MAFGGFGTALRSELYLARRSPAVWLSLGLVCAFAAGRVLLGKLGAAAREVQRAARGAASSGAVESNACGPFVDGMACGLMIGFLMLLIASSAAIARDRELGLSRILLTRRASRGGVVLAKFAALCSLGGLVFAGAGLGSWGASAAFYDFGPVVEDGYSIFSGGEVAREIAAGVGAAALTLPALIAWGLLISVLARSAAEAVGAAALSALAFDALKGLAGAPADYVFFRFAPTLLDASYLKEAAKLARGFSDAGFSDRLWLLNLAAPLPEAALCVGVALWVAGRRKM